MFASVTKWSKYRGEFQGLHIPGLAGRSVSRSSEEHHAMQGFRRLVVLLLWVICKVKAFADSLATAFPCTTTEEPDLSVINC